MAAAATVAGPTIAAARADGPAVITRLSDQRTLSRWAYPLSEATVRASPLATARAVGRLRFLTTDGQAELYVTLASTRLASGRTWLQVEVPGRPNGQTGWVPQEALGSSHVVRGYLLVDRRSLRATLFRDGHAIFSAPVGVGKPSTITPAGHFYVLEKLTTLADPAFGPHAIGTSAYAPSLSEWPGGGVVGIHGTDEPQLIPGRPSHGCIRMRDADITRLWRTIALGTPIDIT
ncbi:MAG TPA: L,D-transpeptidase [Solirubrobacteraceae bacterium]|nr:L,D-transpeptidase [Solirubrobacteraceae bacterium]